ncbi:MAG: glycosyltransferase family 4 protein [Phormidesmis sp.]
MNTSVQARLHAINAQILRTLNRHNLLEIDDIVFVIYPGNKGWILEAICREIAKFFPGKTSFHYATDYLPSAKAYFFSHYSLLPLCLRKNPWIEKSQLLVFYTHPKDLEDANITKKELYSSFDKATKVICMCSSFANLLKNEGVDPKVLTFIVGGADPHLFLGHERGSGSVGFSTAYYPRKSPDLILEIIRQMPHRKFTLLGKRWRMYEHFSEMASLNNFCYVEAPYTDYPKYYADMDVFISPAKLEGGPISLIETMMCNAVPVASRTGFAPDVITHGENGFLFDVDSSVEVICELVEKAFSVQTDVRKTVEHLSWRNFSLEVQKCLINELSDCQSATPLRR